MSFDYEVSEQGKTIQLDDPVEQVRLEIGETLASIFQFFQSQYGKFALLQNGDMSQELPDLVKCEAQLNDAKLKYDQLKKEQKELKKSQQQASADDDDELAIEMGMFKRCENVLFVMKQGYSELSQKVNMQV